MLVLTRLVGERLVIGKNIKLSILEVKGNQVRIGIEAPKNVDVHREEIYLRMQTVDRVVAGEETHEENIC